MALVSSGFLTEEKHAHIMVAVEQDEQGADGRGKDQKSIFAEAVRVYLSRPIADSDFILLPLVITIKRGQVKV